MRTVQPGVFAVRSDRLGLHVTTATRGLAVGLAISALFWIAVVLAVAG